MDTSGSTPFQDPEPSRNALLWLIISRFIISLLGLSYILFFSGRIHDSMPHYITLFVACSINLLYFVWLRTGSHFRTLAFVQIILDLVFETIILYLTGGIFFSIFSFLYFATVIYTPLVTVPEGGLFSGSLATILISLVSIVYVLSERLGFVLPYVPEIYIGRYSQTLGTVLPYLISFGLSLHVVGYLSGRLVERMSLSSYLTQEILNNMAEGVCTLEENGRLHPMNNLAALYLNQDDTESEAKIQDVMPSSLWKQIKNQLNQNQSGRWELQQDRPDDDPRYLEITLSEDPIPAPGYYQSDHFHFLFLRDVTARVEAEEERTRARKLETISNLGASIAHEIRNPLSSIRGAIQEMKEGEGNTEAPDDALIDIVLRESDRVNRIVNDFLDFARERSPDRTTTSLDQIVDEVVAMAQKQVSDRDPNIKTDIPEGLDIYADPDRIKQVFYNLLLNSFEHTEQDEEIKIVARNETKTSFRRNEEGVMTSVIQNGVRVEVLDEGSGIPEEEVSNIFEPFHSSRADGTGLGLAITAQIIRSHNGTIQAENRESGGTRFWFWLPDQS